MKAFPGLKKTLPALIGLALCLVIGVAMASGTERKTSDAQSFRDAEQKRLEELIVSLEGVDGAKVMLTVEENISNKESVSVFGSSSREGTLKVVGAAAVCRGRGGEKLCLEITRLIAGLYGIGANKISVIF